MSVRLLRTGRSNKLPVRNTFLLLSFLMFLAPQSALTQVEPQRERTQHQGEVAGQVINLSGIPVGSAVVTLSGPELLTMRIATTDASGSFIFAGLLPGKYTVSARQGEVVSDTVPAAVAEATAQEMRVVLGTQKRNPANPTSLLSNSVQSVEFSDNPTFTIAGITDWTAVGGHGSDVSLRTSEELAREILALKTQQSGGEANSKASRSKGAEEAEIRLRAALTAAPGDYRANRDLGQYYLRTEQYGKAVPTLKVASSLSQATAEDEYSLAKAYLNLTEYAQAKIYIQRALAHQDAANFHRLAGEVEEKLGNPLVAVQQEEEATLMDPTEENYFTWGSELLQHRAIWQAAEVFSNGTIKHPSSERLKTGWGASLFAGARYDTAAEKFCEASDLNPARVQPYLFMGKIAAVSPEPLSCVEQRLKRFVQLKPESADANYFYAISVLRNDSPTDLEFVQALLKRTISLDPMYSEAYLQLGIISFERRDYREAIDLYKRAIASDPEQDEAYYRLGVAYDHVGEPDEAKREFQIHGSLEKTRAEAVELQRRQVQQFEVIMQRQDPSGTKP